MLIDVMSFPHILCMAMRVATDVPGSASSRTVHRCSLISYASNRTDTIIQRVPDNPLASQKVPQTSRHISMYRLTLTAHQAYRFYVVCVAISVDLT